MSLLGSLVAKTYETRHALARLAYARAVPDCPDARVLERDGVIVRPELLPPNEVAAINRENARFFDGGAPEELIYSPDGKKLAEAAGVAPEELARFYFLHIKNYHEKFDPYARVLPRVDDILSSYYGSRYYVRDLHCYRSQPIPAVQGSYQWHQDNYPPGSLKVMVYLTSVEHEEDGPLAVARGSHAGFKPDLGRVGDRYEESAVNGRHPVKLYTGGPGTVLVFNNNAIHRAIDPRRGRRDVINFTIFPFVLSRPAPTGLDLKEEATFWKRYTR